MSAGRPEKAYEKYAWIILFALGLYSSIGGMQLVIVGGPLDAQGVMNTTGMTSEEIVATNPGLANLISVEDRLLGVTLFSFGIFGMAIARFSFRRGEKWAWYLFLYAMILDLGFIAANFGVGGSFWPVMTLVLVIRVAGLLLPYRKFFPKK